MDSSFWKPEITSALTNQEEGIRTRWSFGQLDSSIYVLTQVNCHICEQITTCLDMTATSRNCDNASFSYDLICQNCLSRMMEETNQIEKKPTVLKEMILKQMEEEKIKLAELKEEQIVTLDMFENFIRNLENEVKKISFLAS
jgi:uncharacterized protein YlaI